ncbi:FHF complex subunit HOOK interacting protein 2A-like isoform X1 [Chironomus tepperi]|uniref:FHF complex subunit HOOK interacting protein 2A-like isoform X1 n=1 Tax=Chironomus tepperi TaxID=113505 RepID=UPI00391F8034
MLGRVLESLEEIIAPSPTLFQNFEYNWKLIKTFYMKINQNDQHIDNTNIPYYMEQMLQILIKEENEVKEFNIKNSDSPELRKTAECLEFLLESKPLDLLVDLAINEKPVGCRRWVLKWIKRYLTCLENPMIAHGSVFKPIVKLMTVCKGALASPYEMDEILFLEAVAGLIGKNPELIKLFIQSHQHSDSTTKGLFNTKPPKHNTLFESNKLEPNIRRVSLMINSEDEEGIKDESNCNANDGNDNQTTRKLLISPKKIPKNCNCDDGDRFNLLDAVMSYIESADSTIVVRACEAILILVSLKELDNHCNAINASFTELSHVIGEKLFLCAELIPEDMNLSDIEECNISWGLFPKDDQQHFIGRYQLTSFLCWLDYADCLVKENLLIADLLGMLFREQVLEKILEPNLLELNGPFGLVLTSKIIKQINSEVLMEEIATWLVGTEINGSDCLLNIIIENAHDNSEVLLQTLQFVESLLDNPNERILHSMIFLYVNTRGYFDSSKSSEIESWSDEEELREKRRGSVDSAVKSRTMAPNNILKVINNFLLLLPRQLMAESVGTCYEEYMQDASRHYQMWIKKTSKFNWPIEATSPTKRPFISKSPVVSNECNDSGISEEMTFYEGPLLRLLFNQIRNMSNQPYELNLASIAILSKLALLPNPFLHEILLSTEIPVAHGAATLFTVIQALSKKLLSEIPRYSNFSNRIHATAKRLLSNPPLMKEEKDETVHDESEQLFEALIVLEEFCKEIAAIAFIKYHHATE